MKINANVHNKFEFELRDASTGKIKQKEVSYNIVLDWFFSIIGTSGHLKRINIGTGTGTLDETRKTLFTHGAQADATNVEVNYNYPTSYVRKKAVFAPNVMKNSSITEVGFATSDYYSYLETHSMLKDSEGNQIAINKGENDILTVYGTVYATCILPEDEGIIVSPDPTKNKIIQYVLGEGYYSTTFYYGMSNRLTDPVNLPNAGALFSVSSAKTVGPDPKIHTIKLEKVAFNKGNFGFISAIGNPDIAVYLLPNSTFFPPVTLTNLMVGVADGVSTEYNSPIPLILKDSEIIRVNGVTQIRGVDYTFDHQNNATFDPMQFISSDRNASVRTGGDSTNNWYTELVTWCMSLGKNVVYSSAPLYLDFGKGILADSIFVAANSIGASKPFTISYSNDNTNWNAFYTSIANNASEVRERLTPVTARYWKLSIEGGSSIYAYKSPNICFGHSRPGLTFTTPPPEGATIEMDCKIDRPLKNENWELDFSMSVQYGRG